MRRLAALLMCVYAMIFSSWAQECTEVLGAVRDVTTSEGSKSHFSSFKRFFCEQTFTSYQQARDAGLKVDIPIEDLPVSFQGHDKSSSWSQYQHSVCESIETFDSLDVTWKNYLARANSAVVEAWSSCINSKGLHFWAEVNEDNPTAVTLVAKFVSSGPPYKTNIKAPISYSGNGLKCPPSAFKSGFIDSARKAADCSRQDDSIATNISLHTTAGDPTIRLRSATASAVGTLPAIRNNVFVPNAMIAVDTDHGVFNASHTAPLSTFPIEWTGPSMSHPPLGTSAKALYKASLLASAPSTDHLAETMSIKSDVGGVCGAAANGGFGGVNPEWRTTIELPRRKGANVWTVNVTSNVTHTVPNASCSVAVEGQVVSLNVNGKSETEFRLDFGEHILDFSCSGQNPFTGCMGHANGVNEGYAQRSYDWTLDAKPAQTKKQLAAKDGDIIWSKSSGVCFGKSSCSSGCCFQDSSGGKCFCSSCCISQTEH